MRILFCAAGRELSPDERQLLIPLISKSRLNRPFQPSSDRILAHALLRLALPHAPEPVYDASGKPYIEGGPYFSLSHSFLAGMCCISQHPVGGDTERVRDVNGDIFRRLCSPDELAEHDPFALWTLKESLSKLSGEGISAFRRIRLKQLDEHIFCSDYSAVKLKYFGNISGYACAAAGVGVENSEIECISVEKILEFAKEMSYNKRA